jgi:hypothetical protein
MKSKVTHISHGVARRIRERAAKNEPFVVVPKNGKVSRTFGLKEFQRMQKQPLRHKPWNSRAAAKRANPDPLQAVEGKPIHSLSREHIYEE